MRCNGDNFYLPIYSTEKTDLHGLPGIFGDGGAIRKAIWIILTLVAWVFVIYQTTLLFVNFFEYHHVTKVDIVYKSTVEFPAITICNFNKYRESAITEDDIVNVGYHLGIVDENHDVISSELYTNDFIAKVAAINWTNTIEDADYNMTDFVYRTGHQQEDFIVKCTWKEEDCDEEYIDHTFTHLGNCYTFNKYSADRERKYSLNAGARNGIRLVLNIEIDEYTPTNDLGGEGTDAGVKLMLHHPTEPPYVKELGFVAAIEQHTYVAMRHEQITSLGSPYTDCLGDDTGGYFDHYSLQGCRIECETKAVEKYCDCRMVEQPSGDGYPVCGPNKTHECADAIVLQVTEGTLANDTCDCRSPCEVEDYPFSTSNAKLRSNYIQKIFSNSSYNFTADYIEKNIAIVSLFYEALNFEIIDQLPEMSFVILLANIGGNLGLFTGASALTAFQIFEYCYDEGAFQLIKSKKKKRVGNTNVSRMAVRPVDAPMRMGDVHSIMDYDTHDNRR